MEDDFAQRIHNEETILFDLRREIETHLFLCNEKDRQNLQAQEEIRKTNEQISHVESDIYATQRDIGEKNHEGAVLRSQIQAAGTELDKLRAERLKD